MAFTKVVGPGIHTLAQLRTHNIHSAGIITATKFVGEMESGGGSSTFQNVTVSGNLTVQGDTTTLNTTLRNVELLRVAANTNTTAGIITQTGTGDILNLFDATTEVLTVVDGGNVGIGLTNPSEKLDVNGTIQCLNELRSKTGNDLLLNAGSANRDVKIQVNDVNMLYVKGDTGNVGINSIIPSQKLDVMDGTVVVHPASKTGIALNGIAGQDVGVVRWGGDNHHAIILRGSSSADGSTITGGNTMEFREYGAYSFKTGNNSGTMAERLHIATDGVLGVRTTPKLWHTDRRAVQIGGAALSGQNPADGQELALTNNAYYDTTNNRWEFIANDDASGITMSNGGINFLRSPSSGTADDALSWSTSVFINDIGYLKTNSELWVGGSSPVLRWRNASSEFAVARITSTRFDLEVANYTKLRVNTAGKITNFYDNSLSASDAQYGQLELQKSGASNIHPDWSYISLHRVGGIAWQQGILDNKFVLAKTGGSAKDTLDTKFVTVDTSGKIGIGKTNPDELLHIASTGTAKFRLTDNRTSISDGSQYGVIQFEQRDSNTPGVSVEVAALMTDTTNGATALQIKTGTPSTIDERVRITSNGSLLLGGTADVTDLTGAPAGQRGLVIGNTGLGNAGIAIINSTTGAGRIYFGDATGSNAARNRGQIAYYHNDSVNSDYMAFSTAAEERLRIASDGRVVIGDDHFNNAFAGGDSLVIGNEDNGTRSGITLVSASNTDGGLYFSRGTSSSSNYVKGQIVYNHPNDYMAFYVDASIRALNIFDTGNVAIGNNTKLASYSSFRHLNVGSNLILNAGTSSGGYTGFHNNTFVNASGNWERMHNDHTSGIGMDDGNFYFRNAAAGTGTVSWQTPLKIITNNRINIGEGNGGAPLGAVHINTSTIMGTDTALFIGNNSDNRFMTINQNSSSEQFSHMSLRYNDNARRAVLQLENPYAASTGFGTQILFQGYNEGTQAYIETANTATNSAQSTLKLYSSGDAGIDITHDSGVYIRQSTGSRGVLVQGHSSASHSSAVVTATSSSSHTNIELAYEGTRGQLNFGGHGDGSVYLQVESGYVLGNATLQFDYSWTPGGNGGIRATMWASHWTAGYDLYWEGFIFGDSYAGLTLREHFARNSGTQGAWSITRPANNKLRISKSAGSYGGGMFYVIMMWHPGRAMTLSKD